MGEFGLNAIGQIHITVGDIDRSVAFYRDVLGMTLLFEVPGQNMAFFNCGGVRLYLGKAENPDFHSRPLIYYKVQSIDDSVKELQSRGVEFDQPPHVVHKTDEHELWMAGFQDPDQNHLVLMAEMPLAS